MVSTDGDAVVAVLESLKEQLLTRVWGNSIGEVCIVLPPQVFT